MLLTFLIWSYTPSYKLIEQSDTAEVTIGETKQMASVLIPYKAILRANNEWQGTTNIRLLVDYISLFQNWEIQDFVQTSANISAQRLNRMMSMDRRLTLFFMGDIPLQTFQTILPFADKEELDMTFNRLIIDWTKYESKEITLYLIHTETNDTYKATVEIDDVAQFATTIIKSTKSYKRFQAIERDNLLPLYVSNEKIATPQYAYFMTEVDPKLFTNVLFTDPNLVQRNVESTQLEKYTDGMSLMTVDTSNKTLNYVYPAAEGNAVTTQAGLLRDSFDFVNEHGGITSDYRYMNADTTRHQVNYQLFLHGFPVYSHETLTQISTIWGDNRVFRYIRPYYSFRKSAQFEQQMIVLPSGKETIDILQRSGTVPLLEIDELIVGYYLSKDSQQNLFILEPNWFTIVDGKWYKVSPVEHGGMTDGLE